MNQNLLLRSVALPHLFSLKSKNSNEYMGVYVCVLSMCVCVCMGICVYQRVGNSRENAKCRKMFSPPFLFLHQPN